ncbi:hypothetical protein L1987_00600 [Smallanthus sonchifolius]|uniref:Uncharacterized protein n=1 Tax=Smallanthus sonchifolius TaxID=185202 RepID=A0ACB9K2T6_9ASTR|nr:hypothetical protein L1987_00600 [Smallanthus sonchifolius]
MPLGLQYLQMRWIDEEQGTAMVVSVDVAGISSSDDENGNLLADDDGDASPPGGIYPANGSKYPANSNRPCRLEAERPRHLRLGEQIR